MFSKLYNPNVRSEKIEVLTKDGTTTVYSKEFDEHYHSVHDGALQESLQKHIIPAFHFSAKKPTVTILDICYGLGFNTLATLFYYAQKSPQTKLHIIAPELDKELVQSLEHFNYPSEFKPFETVIQSISQNFGYEDEQLKIEILIGDARESIKQITTKVDIIYQDAFSPKKNPALWSKEWFSDLKNLSHQGTILTTYSIATPIRLALYENDFNIYSYKAQNIRESTIATFTKLPLTLVDMELKKQRNPQAKALSDSDLSSLIASNVSLKRKN